MRCSIIHCRKKLNRENKVTVKCYDEGDLVNPSFGSLKKTQKLFICKDCAELYTGKVEQDSSFELTQKMEFYDEMMQDCIQFQ